MRLSVLDQRTQFTIPAEDFRDSNGRLIIYTYEPSKDGYWYFENNDTQGAIQQRFFSGPEIATYEIDLYLAEQNTARGNDSDDDETEAMLD